MQIVKTFRPKTLILLAASLATPLPASADDWDWTLVPYVWGIQVSLDVFANDDPVIGADISFEDLMDKRDFAIQLHLAGQRDKTGVFMDITYLNIGDKQTTVANPPLPGDTQVKSDMRTTLFEAGGSYRLSGDTKGLDLLFGARVIDFYLTLDFALPPPLTGTRRLEGNKTITDGFVGLRYSATLADRWGFAARADVGAGGSKSAWNASAYLGYTVGRQQQNVLLMGYRHLALELEESAGNGRHLDTDLTFSGPAVGFAFRF